jgi:hypothetical protein
MFLLENIVSGEKFQNLADMYLGFEDDFKYNPKIWEQKEKHCPFDKIPALFDNPKIIFCYSHRLENLMDKIGNFNKKFVLITHNSDGNITPDNQCVKELLMNDKIIKWYAQNVSVKCNKISPIPIGIANSQWNHGNIEHLRNIDTEKSADVFLNFSIGTNPGKRKVCYDNLHAKIPFIHTLNQADYYRTLGKYKFCICPEGNGFDTHRLWECLHLRCVPIVLKTDFMEILKTALDIPVLMLDNWSDFDMEKLNYTNYVFKDDYCDIEIYKKEINLSGSFHA